MELYGSFILEKSKCQKLLHCVFKRKLYGLTAGANLGPAYQPHITSYDYDGPISEAGSTGQPGIGGDSKFKIIRDAIHLHTGVAPPPEMPPPRITSYGEVRSEFLSTLLHSQERTATASILASNILLLTSYLVQRDA